MAVLQSVELKENLNLSEVELSSKFKMGMSFSDRDKKESIEYLHAILNNTINKNFNLYENGNGRFQMHLRDYYGRDSSGLSRTRSDALYKQLQQLSALEIVKLNAVSGCLEIKINSDSLKRELAEIKLDKKVQKQIEMLRSVLNTDQLGATWFHFGKYPVIDVSSVHQWNIKGLQESLGALAKLGIVRLKDADLFEKVVKGHFIFEIQIVSQEKLRSAYKIGKDLLPGISGFNEQLKVNLEKLISNKEYDVWNSHWRLRKDSSAISLFDFNSFGYNHGYTAESRIVEISNDVMKFFQDSEKQGLIRIESTKKGKKEYLHSIQVIKGEFVELLNKQVGESTSISQRVII